MEDAPGRPAASTKPVCLTVRRDTFYSALEGILAPSVDVFQVTREWKAVHSRRRNLRRGQQFKRANAAASSPANGSEFDHRAAPRGMPRTGFDSWPGEILENG